VTSEDRRSRKRRKADDDFDTSSYSSAGKDFEIEDFESKFLKQEKIKKFDIGDYLKRK